MAETPKQPQYQPGDKYIIPVEGSLGLLALGYRGLQLWRETRDAHLATLTEQKPSEEKLEAEKK